MNLSCNWLRDFVDCSDIPMHRYCDTMTDTGSKVEGYTELGNDIENVVVGRVTKLTRHPDSDHLWVVMVDVGEENDRQIVTGAQNLFEGAMIPVAKAPARLPGGVVIKAGKLRGVASDGMFCSIAELSLTLHDMPDAVEDGILILSEPCKPGDDIHDVLLLRDNVVEFEITSNRPDCLSVIGLARESAASFGRALTIPTPQVRGAADGDDINKHLSVRVDDAEKCLRYTARIVKNVKIAPSPLWMRMRLRASGVRPINNIVDITNYVMLEYGQPMHAFDDRCLDGGSIIVRCAKDGESFVSLDDVPHTLDGGMLVIADAKKACALAGVMGGANSEITADTKTVVFESACFDGPSVRIAAKKLGMRTESSARFEKGLDPENTVPAVQRACELVELLGAGDVIDGIIDCYPGKKPPVTLPLDCERINRFLGVNIPRAEMIRILESLHFTVESDGKGGDTVTAPSYRGDIGCMNDLAEEVIRIYGYNRIESTRFTAQIHEGKLTARQKFNRSLHTVMPAMGYREINTFTFISPKYYDKINLPADDTRRTSIVISNPLGEDTGIMRTTAVPSMLETLSRNDHFHSDSVALYELAKVYLPRPAGTVTNDRGLVGTLPDERLHLVFACYDRGDFYDLKGVVETVLDECGLGRSASFVRESGDSVFHPGRCARVMVGETEIGIFGELHPAVAKNYDLDKRAFLAVLDTENLFALAVPSKAYHPLPKFPATTRDLAFVCDEGLEVAAIEKIIRTAGGKLLDSLKLFDVYRGSQLPDGKKSVAYNLSLRAADHTLTDEEADKATKKIRTLLERDLGVTLRA